MSEEDINKGAKWAGELAAQLESTNFGVVCLTPENKSNDWLLYETGSLSKQIKGSYVIPYLFSLAPSEVTGPFALFQMARTTKEDTFKVLSTINEAAVDGKLLPQQLRLSFEKWWPDLEQQINLMPAANPRKPDLQPERSSQELLEEILARVRNLPRELSIPSGAFKSRKSNREVLDRILLLLSEFAPTDQYNRLFRALTDRVDESPAFLRDLLLEIEQIKPENAEGFLKSIVNHFILGEITRGGLVRELKSINEEAD